MEDDHISEEFTPQVTERAVQGVDFFLERAEPGASNVSSVVFERKPGVYHVQTNALLLLEYSLKATGQCGPRDQVDSLAGLGDWKQMFRLQTAFKASQHVGNDVFLVFTRSVVLFGSLGAWRSVGCSASPRHIAQISVFPGYSTAVIAKHGLLQTEKCSTLLLRIEKMRHWTLLVFCSLASSKL